jgi:hypothetical protein
VDTDVEFTPRRSADRGRDRAPANQPHRREIEVQSGAQCLACPPGFAPENNVCVELDNPGLSVSSITGTSADAGADVKEWPLTITGTKMTAYLLHAPETPFVLFQPGESVNPSKFVPLPLLKDSCNVVRLVLEVTDQKGETRSFSTADPKPPTYSTEQPFDPYVFNTMMSWGNVPILSGGTLTEEGAYNATLFWDTLAWAGGYTLAGRTVNTTVRAHNASAVSGVPPYPGRSAARYPIVLEGINGNVCPPAASGPFMNW